MTDLTIRTTEPKRRTPNTALMACAGAVIGSGARYVLPTRKELSAILNKETTDTFFSAAASSARASSRSIVKYGAVGALVAACGALIAKAVNHNNKEEKISDIEYSKYSALLDSTGYACQVMWWED